MKLLFLNMCHLRAEYRAFRGVHDLQGLPAAAAAGHQKAGRYEDSGVRVIIAKRRDVQGTMSFAYGVIKRCHLSFCEVL